MWNLLKTTWVHRELGLVIVLTGIAMASLSLPQEKGSTFYRRINRTIITPFQLVIDRIELYEDAVQRSKELEEENIRLSLALHAMKMIEEENHRLRVLLDFTAEKGVEFVAARVIGYNLAGPLSSCVIDKGSLDDVQPFLPVMTPAGLVGKVAEVDPRSSVVELFTSSGFSVSGMVIGEGDVGIVTTRGTRHLYLDGLNLQTGVKAGDRVVSSGLGGVFPVGIPIGTVKSVEMDPLGVHRVASLIPIVRLDQVREVFVLTDSRYVKADPLWLTRAEGSISSLWNDPSDGAPGIAEGGTRPDGHGQDEE